MKLSTKCRYGTRAMIQIAANFPIKPTTRREISELEGISPGYLENILAVLRGYGLVTTARGVEGGFTLSKAPDKILLLDIVSALEGTIAPVDCILNPDTCERNTGCAACKAWKRLYDAQVAVLSDITLADLLATKNGSGNGDFVI